MTVLQLITSALRRIGVATRGHTLSAEELSDALEVFQMMMDSWTSQRLLIPTRTSETFTLPSGVQSFTLGATGADVTTVRPEKVFNLLVRIAGADYPCSQMTDDEYQQITLKGQSGGWPSVYFYKPTFPNGTLYVWPVAGAGYTIVMESQKPAGSAAYLVTDSLVMPPEYNLAVVLNLARLMAPEYGKSLSPEDMQMSIETLAHIKNINSPAVRSVAAPELMAHFGNRGVFDIRKGSFQ